MSERLAYGIYLAFPLVECGPRICPGEYVDNSILNSNLLHCIRKLAMHISGCQKKKNAVVNNVDELRSKCSELCPSSTTVNAYCTLNPELAVHNVYSQMYA